MSGRQPRQVQRKLGEADSDGNWQLGSPAPVSATDDKTQSVAGYKRRAPTAAAGPYSASNLQAAIHHNAAKESRRRKQLRPNPWTRVSSQCQKRRSRLLLPRQTRIWQLRFRSTCPWQASSRSRRRARMARPNTRARYHGLRSHATRTRTRAKRQ